MVREEEEGKESCDIEVQKRGMHGDRAMDRRREEVVNSQKKVKPSGPKLATNRPPSLVHSLADNSPRPLWPGLSWPPGTLGQDLREQGPRNIRNSSVERLDRISGLSGEIFSSFLQPAADRL